MLLNGLITNNGKPDDMNEEIMLRLVLTFIHIIISVLFLLPSSLCGVLEGKECNEEVE